MPFIKLLFIFLALSPVTFAANTKLPKLITKQEILNIRYKSTDGKVTYFQNQSGELILTTLHKNHLLLKLPKNTQYVVNVSHSKKLIVVEADVDFHSNLNFNKLNQIYYGAYGSPELKKVAKGVDPQLNFNDQWISYYNPIIKELYFQNTKDLKQNYNIKLTNELNPYFRPKAFVLNKEILFYTDLNNLGFSAIMAYFPETKKFMTVFKTKAPGMKVEFCFIDKLFIVGEFSIYDINRGSSISVYDTVKDPEFSEPKLIYTSSLSDLGHFVCDNLGKRVYFVKSLQENLRINYKVTEAVSINPLSGDVQLHSDLMKVTQILQMDERIMIPYLNDFYVIKGPSTTEGQNLISLDDYKLIKGKIKLNEFSRKKKRKKKKRRVCRSRKTGKRVKCPKKRVCRNKKTGKRVKCPKRRKKKRMTKRKAKN
jgi:hypothetical protein